MKAGLTGAILSEKPNVKVRYQGLCCDRMRSASADDDTAQLRRTARFLSNAKAVRVP